MVSLHSLINQRFGVRTRHRENPAATAITTTSQIILRNDSARLGVLVTNLGETEVRVRPSGVPTGTIGSLIGPNGGTMTLIIDEDFNTVGLEWQAVVLAGTGTIYVSEVVVEPDAEI